MNEQEGIDARERIAALEREEQDSKNLALIARELHTMNDRLAQLIGAIRTR